MGLIDETMLAASQIPKPPQIDVAAQQALKQSAVAGAAGDANTTAALTTPPVDNRDMLNIAAPPPTTPDVSAPATSEPPAAATGTVAPPTTPPATGGSPYTTTTGLIAPEQKARTITDKETVSGQLNDLLNENGKYMQSAKANAMTQANSRGLLNSSMAVGAGQKAAIDSALPIATADANVNANAGYAAQIANQNLAQTGYQADIATKSAEQNFGYQKDLNDQNFGNQTKLNDQNFTNQKDLNQQNFTNQAELDKRNLEAKSLLENQLKDKDLAARMSELNTTQQNKMSEIIGNAWQQLQVSINTINSKTNAEMDAQAKADSINKLVDETRSFIKFTMGNYGMAGDWVPSGVGSNPVIAGGGSGSGATPFNNIVETMQNYGATTASSGNVKVLTSYAAPTTTGGGSTQYQFYTGNTAPPNFSGSGLTNLQVGTGPVPVKAGGAQYTPVELVSQTWDPKQALPAGYYAVPGSNGTRIMPAPGTKAYDWYVRNWTTALPVPVGMEKKDTWDPNAGGYITKLWPYTPSAATTPTNGG